MRQKEIVESMAGLDYNIFEGQHTSLVQLDPRMKMSLLNWQVTETLLEVGFGGACQIGGLI
jgi:hypothetical protein